MYILLNRDWGGFGFNENFSKKYGIARLLSDSGRADPDIIKAVIEYGIDNVNDSFSKIRLYWIPDDATDYDINNYDGMESIVYVMNGKLRYDAKEIKDEDLGSVVI